MRLCQDRLNTTLRDSTHGRTEHLAEEGVQFLSDGDIPELPKAEWQKQITIEYVQRYFDDTEEIIEYLHGASGLDFNPLFVPETSDWRITPANDDRKA